MRYSFKEEFIDDPHWNSGFWETHFTFSDGVSFSLCSKREDITDESILARHKEIKFDVFWGKNKEIYRELAYKEFELTYND